MSHILTINTTVTMITNLNTRWKPLRRSRMSAINVLAHESIQTPSVAWTGLLPIIILATAGILLLTICSLFPEKVTNKFASVYTQLAAVAALSSTFSLWDKVQNKSEGPYSTLAGAFGVDGFSIFVTMLITCLLYTSPSPRDLSTSRMPSSA